MRVRVVVYEVEERGMMQPPESVVPLKEKAVYTRELRNADIDEVVLAVNRIESELV